MKRFLVTIICLVIPIVLFGATIRGLSGNPNSSEFKGNLDQATKPFELSPERGRYAHVYTLAVDNRYDLTKEWADAVYPDVGYSGGKFYSFFAPGVSYLALPFYELGSRYDLAQVGTFAFISLCALFNLIFIYIIGKRILSLPTWAAMFASLVFGFATSSWSYAITLYQHHVFTLLVLTAIYSTWRYKQGSASWGLIVWLNYGLAILIDYPNAILFLPVMAYFLIVSVDINRTIERTYFNVRVGIILTVITFVAVTGFHFYHNQIHFGSWKNLSGGIVGYKAIVENDILNIENPDEAIAELAADKNVVEFFREQVFSKGFYTLIFSKDRGLMLYTPILLLGILGMIMAARRINLEHGIFISFTLVNLLLYSSWGDPWGGWAFGPRYLIPGMSILALYAAWFLTNVKYPITSKIVALVLFIYSSGVAILGALTTNAVPPKIEADYLGMKYNYLYNWEFLNDGKSGSFMYNTFLHDDVSLLYFAGGMLALTTLIAIILLFIVPLFRKNDSAIIN